MTAKIVPDERARLQGLEELLEEWKGRLLEDFPGRDAAAGTVDSAYAERFEETSRRLLSLNEQLHEEDFDPEALAEMRGIILEGLAILDAVDDARPLDKLEQLLVRTEAMRHLVRDALDGHVEGVGEDARAAVAALDAWLPGVSRQEIALLLGRSPRQVQRWAKEGGAPPRRLKLMARLVAILHRAWTPEGVVAWFSRARRDLDGKTPLAVLDDPTYERALLIAVRQGRAQHGS